MNQFGSLQSTIMNADKIKKPPVMASIVRNTERLQINYTLIKLDDKVAIPLGLNELAYIYNGITTHEVLKGIKLLSERNKSQ